MITKIKKLRELTQAPVIAIKKALEESCGDLKKAEKLLQKRGETVAQKVKGRVAQQGLIASYIHQGRIGAMVEVNCETDFVARNPEFQELAKELAVQVAAYEGKTIGGLLKEPYFRNETIKVSDLINQKIGKLGENIQLRRFVRFVLGEDKK